VRKLSGFSPLLAREVVYRATGRANTRTADTSAYTLLEEIETILMPVWERNWQPCVAEDAGGSLKAFAPYPLTHLENFRPVESISEAVETFYGAIVGVDPYQAAKEPVRAALEDAQDRLRHKLNSLESSQTNPAEIDRLRKSGELILAYQYNIEPGQQTLTAAYEVDGPELDIKLDPTLSPVANAQRYFKRYEKAKSAGEDVPKLVRAAKREAAFLEQLALDLELAASWPEVDEVREALEEHGFARGPRQARPKGGKPSPLRITTDDGFIIWVGRNARQNDEVTFSRGGPEDLWLHVRGAAGAHVIVKHDGRQIPAAVIEQAAALAARYSPMRGEARVLVDVTQRKHVRKIRGGKPGMVTYRNEEPVEVAPALED
jgi:predicted ribosome quality control (RQC) complex YloA/Tae2 family protein